MPQTISSQNDFNKFVSINITDRADISSFNVSERVNFLFNIYSDDLLKTDYGNNDNFYKCVIRDLDGLLNNLLEQQRKDFALSICRKIKDYDSIIEDSNSIKWFLAAITYKSFDILKEYDAEYRTAFASLHKEYGQAQGFSRLIVVAATNFYVLAKIKSDRTWFKSIYKADGDVIGESTLLLSDIDKAIIDKVFLLWGIGSMADARKAYEHIFLYAFIPSYNRTCLSPYKKARFSAHTSPILISN